VVVPSLSRRPLRAGKGGTGGSASVTRLNREGADGWEAIGMTALADGHFAVLLKRALDD
jgi:hypothetical protein